MQMFLTNFISISAFMYKIFQCQNMFYQYAVEGFDCVLVQMYLKL